MTDKASRSVAEQRVAVEPSPDKSPTATPEQSPRVRKGARDVRDAGAPRRTDRPQPRPGSLAERSQNVGKGMAKLRSIRLAEPRQVGAQADFDEVRLTGLEMRGMPMLGMTLFETTGAGKTTTAEQYAQRVNADADEDQIPILHVRLDNAGTARSLYVDILSRLGDGFALNGTEHCLRRRALDALGDAGTELLIIDESHHGGRRSGFGGEITSSVKLLLDAGVVPIALLGTEDAVPVFAKDLELSGRLMAPCQLGPLRWTDEYDREIWCGLLQALDERMVADGVVTSQAGFAEKGLDKALIEATNGIIGQLMGTVRTALRSTIRDGRSSITRADLIQAVDLWNVGHHFITYNPLRDN